MYFANPTGAAKQHMLDGLLGFIDTPAQGSKRPDGVVWCADNGCFSDAFDEAKWWRFLEKNAGDPKCVFATAPDVVGDHAATLERSRPWLPKIRALGYRAAFVVQDGATVTNVPWGEFDVIFIGGAKDNRFKLGPTVRQLVAEAKRLGKWVHMGRVNSGKRYRYAECIGCDSADGTYLTKGPDKNLPKLLGWLRDLDERPALVRLIGEPS